MKRLLLPGILAFTLFSCSGDDSENGPKNTLRKEIVVPFAADKAYSVRYFYDGYRLTRALNSNGTEKVYYYDGDLIVNVKTYVSKEATLIAESRFQYDNGGRLVQEETFDYHSGAHGKKQYVYNPDATVTENVYTVDASGIDAPLSGGQLVFENGQLASSVFQASNPPSATVTTQFTYDDKSVPQYNIIGYDKISAFDPLDYHGSVHNLVWVTQTDTSTDFVTSYDLLHEYNQNGAPTWFSYGESGSVIIDGGSIQYFYN